MQSNQKSKSLQRLEDVTYKSLAAIEDALCDLYNIGVDHGHIGYSAGDLGEISETLDVICESFSDILDELNVNSISKEKMDTFSEEAFLQAKGINFAVAKFKQRIDIIKSNLDEKG